VKPHWRSGALLALCSVAASAAPSQTETAVFAGGCFWCLEARFEAQSGVISVDPGYTGGTLANPSYRDVTAQTTGHYEAVQVRFDPARVSYGRLLVLYWLGIDPTDPDGQFCERGASKRAAVFALDATQAAKAETVRARAQAVLNARVVTPILHAGTFWPAEEYHRDYARKNPLRLEFYRRSCGREAGLRAIWGARPMLASDP